MQCCQISSNRPQQRQSQQNSMAAGSTWGGGCLSLQTSNQPWVLISQRQQRTPGPARPDIPEPQLVPACPQLSTGASLTLRSLPGGLGLAASCVTAAAGSRQETTESGLHQQSATQAAVSAAHSGQIAAGALLMMLVYCSGGQASRNGCLTWAWRSGSNGGGLARRPLQHSCSSRSKQHWRRLAAHRPRQQQAVAMAELTAAQTALRQLQHTVWDTSKRLQRHKWLHRGEQPNPCITQQLQAVERSTTTKAVVALRAQDGTVVFSGSGPANIAINHYARVSRQPQVSAPAKAQVLAAIASQQTTSAVVDGNPRVTAAKSSQQYQQPGQAHHQVLMESLCKYTRCSRTCLCLYW